MASISAINRLLFVWILLFSSMSWASITYAQNDCQLLLREAQQTFDRSLPEEILNEIEACLITRDTFTSTEHIEVLRLLTITHVHNQNFNEADRRFKQILQLDPEFRVYPKYDGFQEEVLHTLYKDFRTAPRMYIRMTLGGTITAVRELQYVSSIQNDPTNKDYSPNLGFLAGASVAFPIYKRNVRLQIGANYAQLAFSLQNSMRAYLGELPNESSQGNFGIDSFQVNLTENQQWLQIPLLLTIDFDKWSVYNFDKNLVVPFLYVGATVHQLLAVSYSQIRWESGLGQAFSSSTFNDLSELRRKSNVSLTLGGGVKGKIDRHYLMLDLRYDHWLQNVANANNRYSNPELVYRFGQVDSDFTLGTFSLSVGYEIPSYRRKRIRNKNKP